MAEATASGDRARAGWAGRARPSVAALLAHLAASGCAPPDPGVVRECRPAGRQGCPAAAESAFVDPLTHLGRAESSTFIEITDVVAEWPRVYACTGVRGLSIWDAEPDAPRRLVEGVAPADNADPSFPRCQHLGLDAAAQRVVITNRGDEIQPTAWIAAFDVADPSRPRELADWVPSTGSIEGAVLHGDRVYVARHTLGIATLEIRGEEMVVLGTYTDPLSDAWQPARAGDVLFVAEGATGLRSYDVSGDEPRLLATVPIAGSSRDVVLDGETAYVAASGAVAVVDVADPAAPRLSAELSTHGTALALAVAGPGLIVVAEWNELRGYDVTDPSAPRLAFAETVPTSAEFSRTLAVDASPDQRRVFAGEWQGLHQLALADGDAPDSWPAGPEVTVSPGAIQFGRVAPGDSDTAVMIVRNEGDRRLTVHDIATAAAVTVDQDCFDVEAGSAVAVEVTLAPDSDEELSSAVAVCSDDPDEPSAAISLSANIEGRDVGDAMPSFALQDMSGRTWTPEDLRGSVAVLAYFATF